MRRSNPIVRVALIALGALALIAILSGCDDAPFEPGSGWLIGGWRFERDGCWAATEDSARA
jgi:hypothetical protein